MISVCSLQLIMETESLSCVCFFPQFHEVLSIRSSAASLDVQLTGMGVTPDIRLDLEDSKLDFGHVLKGGAATASFNVSFLAYFLVVICGHGGKPWSL